MATTLLSGVGVLITVIMGALAVESVRARYGLRLGGVVAVPLTAVLALTNVVTLPLYLGGVAVVFAITTAIHRQTLIYGRVLLALTLIAAMSYGLVLATVGVAVTDLQLFFASLFAGMGAYTLHLTAPADRPATVALSAGLFTVTLVACRLVVTPPRAGLLTDVGPLAILPVAVVLTAAGVTLARLERRERPLDAHRTEVLD